MSSSSYAKFYEVLMTSPWLPASTKVVLTALANFNRQGRCNPKIETLCRTTGQSRATVKRALHQLGELKIVQITWGQRQSSYRIAALESWPRLLMAQNEPSEINPDGSKRANTMAQNEPSEPSASLLLKRDIEKSVRLRRTPVETIGASAPGGRSTPAAATCGLTINALRESYPSVDEGFGRQLVQAAARAAASIEDRKLEFSDSLVADAVRRCVEDTPNQNGPGLFLRTVPQCVATWIQYGREPRPKPPRKLNRTEQMLADIVAREKAKGQGA
jgi:hypothetical protein